MFHRTLLVRHLRRRRDLSRRRRTAQTPIPSTPAGQTLQAWLTAFNSGDRALVDAYVPQVRPEKLAERNDVVPQHDRRPSNSSKFYKVNASNRIPRQRSNSATKAIGNLDVKDADPAESHRLRPQALRPTQISPTSPSKSTPPRAPGHRTAPSKISTSSTSFPDTARKWKNSVRTHQKQWRLRRHQRRQRARLPVTTDFQASPRQAPARQLQRRQMPERTPMQNQIPREIAQQRKANGKNELRLRKSRTSFRQCRLFEIPTFFGDPTFAGPRPSPP